MITRRVFMSGAAAGPLLSLSKGLTFGNTGGESQSMTVGDACTSMIGLFDDFYFILMEPSLSRLAEDLRRTDEPIRQLLEDYKTLKADNKWNENATLEDKDNLIQTEKSFTSIQEIAGDLGKLLEGGGDEIAIGDSRDAIVYVKDQTRLISLLFDQVLRGLISTRLAIDKMNDPTNLSNDLPYVENLDAGARFRLHKYNRWGDFTSLQESLHAVTERWDAISPILDGNRGSTGQRAAFIAAVSQVNTWNGRLHDDYQSTLASIVEPIKPLRELGKVDHKRFDATVDLIMNLYQGSAAVEVASLFGNVPLAPSADQVIAAIRNHCGVAGYTPSNLQVHLIMFAHSVCRFIAEDRRLYALTSVILWIEPAIRMSPKRIRSIAAKIAAEIL